MKKDFKVITINGIRGIFAAIFIVLGLIAGFIISPGWVCMHLWNVIFADSNIVAHMNIYQGIMLWAIIALSFYALNGRRSLIGFGAYRGLSPEQIKDIMKKSRMPDDKVLKELEAITQEQISKIEKLGNSIREESLNTADIKQEESEKEKEKIGE